MTTPPVKPSVETRAIVRVVEKVVARYEQNRHNAVMLRSIRGVQNLNATRKFITK